jgi:preprotein translocase subunit SecB
MTDNQTTQQPMISANGQLIKGLTFFREEILLDDTTENTQPKIDITLNLNNKALKEDVHEVTLEIIAKASLNERELFNVERDYAGIFTIKHFNPEQQEQILHIHCPTLIFPFARRVLADTTREAGFFPLMLDPVDFASLYNQKKEQQQAIKN